MKRILACCLISISLLQPSTLAVEYGMENNQEEKTYTQTFEDVPTMHWSFSYVADLVDRNVLNGYPDGNFYPDKTVSREAFAKILTLAAGETVTTATTTYFADVPTTLWSAPYINVAQSYMTAYNLNDTLYFKPTESAVREDMAVAIVKMKGYDTSLADLEIIQTMFSDYNQISESAKPYIAIAVEKGVISGFTDGTFRPQATITRAESAAMLWRAFQYGSDNKVVVGDEDIDDLNEDTAEVEEGTSYITTLNTNASTFFVAFDDGQKYDTDGNFYYMEDNNLMKISSGVTSTVLNGDNMSYSLSSYEIECDTATTPVTYNFEDITINEIEYQPSNDTVYVELYAYAWEQKVGYYFIIDINKAFSLSNAIHVSAKDYDMVGTNECMNLVISSPYYLAEWRELNVENKEYNVVIQRSGTYPSTLGVAIAYFNDEMFYSSNIYTADTYNTGYLATYSYGNNELNNILLYDEANNTIKTTYTRILDGIRVYNNKLYMSTQYGIYTIEEYRDGYQAKVVVNYDDIEVLDKTSFTTIYDFIFDDDGNIIFRDYTNGRIRKLTIQE